MPNGRSGCHGRSLTPPHSQRGVVLLIALIMLVAMTLAGIGLMRSVDTGSMIAGNLAFRHATSQASDAGTSTGFNALMAMGNSANANDKGILNFDGSDVNGNPVTACASVPLATAAGCPGAGFVNLPGYFSAPVDNGAVQTCQVTGGCAGQPWWQNANNWVDPLNTHTITVSEPITNTTIATVTYLIHRMCQLPNVAPSAALNAGQLCQTYTQSATGCSKTQKLPCTSTSVFYRITARSVGPRNTVSYTQTLALIGL